LTLLIVATAIIANILINMRRRYYHLSSGKRGIAIDEVAIQQLLNAYWHQNFPGQDIPSLLTLRNNTIHINVELPGIPIDEQEPFLERTTQDLQGIFANILGYNSEFFISANFKPQTTQTASKKL
jgi:hypothetical protein